VSVDKIKNAIIGEARKEADRIREAGRMKADEKFRTGEQRLRQQHEQRVREAREKHEDLKNREVIALRSSLSMELLAAKNATIEAVLDKAAARLLSLPSNGYRSLLLKWLIKAAPGERGELVLNAQDHKAFGQQLVADANKRRGKDAVITLAQQAGAMRGGFILRTARYEIDRTLDSSLAKLREEMAPEIAAELFHLHAEGAESK